MKEIITFVETEKKCPYCHGKMMKKIIIHYCSCCKGVKEIEETREHRCMSCGYKDNNPFEFIDREPIMGC